jgi:hypothetical protein
LRIEVVPEVLVRRVRSDRAPDDRRHGPDAWTWGDGHRLSGERPFRGPGALADLPAMYVACQALVAETHAARQDWSRVYDEMQGYADRAKAHADRVQAYADELQARYDREHEALVASDGERQRMSERAEAAEAALVEVRRQLEIVYGSRSWKFTEILRRGARAVNRGRR